MSALRSTSFERILLVKPTALGDVVHAIPVLVKLRARYPNARIDWLVTPENAELVRHHPALSDVVPFPRRQWARFGREWSATLSPFRLLAELRRSRYDLVVDLHGQLRTAVCTLATGAATRVGFDRPRRGVPETSARQPSDRGRRHGWAGAREGAWLAYTHRIVIPTLDVHAVDRYLWVGPLLGLDDGPPDFQIHLAPESEAVVDRLWAEHGLGRRPLVVLAPGTLWPTKHWPADGFAGVARHWLGSGTDVALIGSSSDRERVLCRSIAEACPGAIDLSGRTTPAELAALIRRATLCVTNDSGSMHLAVALGRRVVSVFGPTDPVRVGPYGRAGSVVRADVPCSPCHLRRLSQCPHDHVCMERVSPGMVVEACERVLAS